MNNEELVDVIDQLLFRSLHSVSIATCVDVLVGDWDRIKAEILDRLEVGVR